LAALVIGAAGPVPNAAPASPDNETTALQPFTDTHIGITPNSMGTTTNTGTPAQSAAREYQPGSRQPPPNVREPLAPAPILPPLPSGVAVPRRPNQIVPGHSLTGSFAGMAGAVNATKAMPLEPYRAILAPSEQVK